MNPGASSLAAALLALATLACARTLSAPAIPPDALRAGEQSAAEAAFSGYVAGAERLLRITERLRIANAEHCGKDAAPYLGWFVLAERDVDRSLRELAVAALGLAPQPVVLALSPESPAAKAGVRVRDEITAIDGKRVRSADQLARRVFDLKESRAPLSVRRGDEELTLVAVPERACAYEVLPRAGGSLDGPWAWKRRVSVSLGLADVASDDELAYLIARAVAVARMEGPYEAEEEDRREVEAARVAVEFTQRAGYSVEGVERLLEIVGRERPEDLVDTDSGSPRIRVAGVRRAAAVVGPIPKRILALRAARAALAE